MMNQSGTEAQNLVSVLHLRSQHPTELLGLPLSPVLLSWQVAALASELSQIAAEIQVASEPTFSSVLANQLVQGTSQIEVEAPGGPFNVREVRYYRVRVQTELGWSSFSETYAYEAGITPADFVGEAIGNDSNHSEPATLLRKSFKLGEKPLKARLYVSAHGVYEASINGISVSAEYLNPGWTAYQARLNYETFDVTDLFNKGLNAIGFVLGDGWYRGKMGFMAKYDNYGINTSALAQLELEFEDGSREVVATDASFKTGNGEIRFADIYDGCTIDLNKAVRGWDTAEFDDSTWKHAIVREFDKSSLQPRIAEPIRAIAEFPVVLTKQTDRTLLDVRQNISGWVRLTVDGKKGQTVVVRHAEVLEPGQKLHTKALRSARATDTYILDSDGRHVLEPRLTFHGFQYADVVTDAEVISGVGIAISSDIEQRSTFSSSDTRLNRLHENVVWSQRDNFVGLPTDCPQRDERLGWTGDAQAFAYAANTLVDAQSFWRSWLIDLELDQDELGNVAAVVPDIVSMQPSPDGDWETMGRAGWADAATIVPYAMYESFGSLQILSQQLNSMRRWTEALHNRRAGQKFLPTEFQFGDWCDPDAPGDMPWQSKVSADYVANAFFAHTAELTAKVEELVGTPVGAEHYRKMSEALKADIWTEMGAEALTTTAGCAIALEFEICPVGERALVAKTLADMVRRDKGKITTGFLGTPLILHALSKNGYPEEAYLMLMRREIRSWLYQVDRGATTIWERWDAIHEDGTINSGAMATENEHQEDASMISFNHYAYGAVVDWVYRNVAGLAPVPAQPGYRRTIVSPKPAKGFSFASATIESPYGELSIDWEMTLNGDLVVQLNVPFGVTAELDLPSTDASKVYVNGELSTEAQLSYGQYLIRVTHPSVIEYKG